MIRSSPETLLLQVSCNLLLVLMPMTSLLQPHPLGHDSCQDFLEWVYRENISFKELGQSMVLSKV